MIYIIFFIASVIGDVVITALLPTTPTNKLVLGLISGCILMVILTIIISKIYEMVQDQTEDKYKIKEYKKDIEVYKAELEEYKKNIEHNLLPMCKEFELKLMQDIKDSKLIAAVLKEGSYSSLTIQHAGRIRQLVLDIHGSERIINELHRKMLARQECNLFSYGWFIPAHLRIAETENQ